MNATCGRESSFLDEKLTALLNYQIITADNINIFMTSEKNLPTKALYPVNIIIDIAKYLSGPLINISGVIKSESNVVKVL